MVKKIDTIKIGDCFEQTFVATGEKIDLIATVSDDTNKVHLDEEYARQKGFDGRIAHGLFCLNGISKMLGNDFPGDGAILVSETVNYKKPVYINDSIKIRLEVVEIKPENDLIFLDVICMNQDEKIVLEGKVVVVWR